jgi:hypothetical protein
MNYTISIFTGLCVTFICSLFAVCPVTAQQISAPEVISGNATAPQVRGMWVWSEHWINTDQARNDLLDFCERFGFNLVLIQIHEDKQAEEYTIKYPGELTQLVAEAAGRGISVEALDGANNMAFAANQPRTLSMLDALIDLNQSMPEGKRLTGVHYDIEPYTSAPWKAGQASRDVVMTDLLEFYVKARQKLDDRGSQMTLSSDIPMWYDAKTAEDDHCIVTFQGQTKNLHQHIQDLCDYVGIMSYRQRAVGPNSASELIANELAYAEKIGKRICAALETIELEETPQITFYGKSPDALWEQVSLLGKNHAGRPGYAGVLLHCYRGLRDLLPNE